jgi:hypothetical protein
MLSKNKPNPLGRIRQAASQAASALWGSLGSSAGKRLVTDLRLESVRLEPSTEHLDAKEPYAQLNIAIQIRNTSDRAYWLVNVLQRIAYEAEEGRLVLDFTGKSLDQKQFGHRFLPPTKEVAPTESLALSVQLPRILRQMVIEDGEDRGSSEIHLDDIRMVDVSIPVGDKPLESIPSSSPGDIKRHIQAWELGSLHQQIEVSDGHSRHPIPLSSGDL